MKIGCVMLMSPGREAYQMRAVKAYNEQTFHKTGAMRLLMLPADPSKTIGTMRNHANEMLNDCDIVCHWDDDDWSHPNRIAEQVSLLQATGADVVGYNEMLFWAADRGGLVFDEANAAKPGKHWPMDVHRPAGEAWLYSNPNPRYALGTSLCYWRRVWGCVPFPDLQHGEDTEWIRGIECHSIPTFTLGGVTPERSKKRPDLGPRMIARIHAGNSSSAYDPIEMARHNVLPRSERQWSRVPERDNVCREVMEG